MAGPTAWCAQASIAYGAGRCLGDGTSKPRSTIRLLDKSMCRRHHVSCGLSLSEVFQRHAFAMPVVGFPEDVGGIGARALGQHEPAGQAS